MATIKSALVLEDKMSPTLSKAHTQAVANIKAYEQLEKQLKSLDKQEQELYKAGLQGSNIYKQLEQATANVVTEMQEYENGARNAKVAQEELNNSQDNGLKSVVGLNQGLELLSKGWSALKRIMQEANNWMDLSNTQFNSQYSAAIKMQNKLGAIPEQVQSLNDYAAALQKVGVVGDEATIAGMGTLTTYASNLDQVTKLTPAILDLAVAENGTNTSMSDVISAAQKVGYALNGNATMIKRLIGASDAEIETLNNMNDKTKKAEYLYKLLERGVGGANEALAKTAQGGIMQANNALGDMQEELGTAVIPYWSMFKQLLVSAVTPAIQFLVAHMSIIAPMLIGIGIAVGIAIVALTVYITWTTISTFVTAALGNAAMATSLKIVAMALIIGVLIGVLLYFWNTNDEVAYYILLAWDSLQLGVMALKLACQAAFYAIIIAALYMYQGFLGVKMGLLTAFYMLQLGGLALKLGFQGVCQGIVNTFIWMYNKIADILNKLGGNFEHMNYADFTSETTKAISSKMEEYAEAALAQYSEMSAVSDKIAEYQSELASVINEGATQAQSKAAEFNATRNQRVQNRTKVTAQSITNAVSDAIGGLSGIGDSINSAGNGGKAVKNATGKDSTGATAIKTTTNDDLLSDDDIQLLLDVATRDYKLNYQQITPEFTLTFGDIRETADVDIILNKVADKLEALYNGNLRVV